MRSQAEIRDRVNHVVSFPVAERERIYRKYFAAPSSSVRSLCDAYHLDQKRVLDVGRYYGYHLIHFGDDSYGLDASPQYLRFAREVGLNVQEVNMENGFPQFDRLFDGLFFSGTLEEVLSSYVVLMRFRVLLKPDGLLFLRVPTVPRAWFDGLYRLRAQPGYDAAARLYFFTPRPLDMTVKRAGYEVIQMVASGLWQQRWLRPAHDLLLPLTPTVIIIARPRADFVYPTARAMRFLPAWASDLGPYHQDYQNGQTPDQV